MSEKSVAIKGGLWMSVSTAVTMLTQFLRLIILTRFLEKSDFGIVSIVNMVVGLCLTFTDLGFATAIMYKQQISEKEFSTLFWIQFLLYTLIYLFLSLFAPLVANFYNEKTLVFLIPLAGISVLLQSLGKLYDSVLQKRYQFRFLAIVTIITNLTSLILAWFLAAYGFGVYSLILSTLFQIAVMNICLFVKGFHFQKIIFKFALRETLPMVKMGIYQTGTHIFDFLSYKLDVMIIGKFLGVEVLGVYDLAKELVVKFVGLIRTVVSKVALPILANNNNNDEAVKVRFLQITKIVALICIPICVALSVFSKEIVLILYGEKFYDAADIVSVFAFVTMITSISCFIDMLGISKGRTDLNFKNTIFRILITTPIVVVTSFFSINAVVWGQLLTAILAFFGFWKIVAINTYPMPLKLYLSQFSKCLIVICSVGGITWGLKYLGLFSMIDSIVFSTILYAIIFLLLLVLASKILLANEVRYVLNIFGKRRNK